MILAMRAYRRDRDQESDGSASPYSARIGAHHHRHGSCTKRPLHIKPDSYIRIQNDIKHSCALWHPHGRFLPNAGITSM